MIVTKNKCFKDKFNFWEKVLSTLINLPVDKRCSIQQDLRSLKAINLSKQSERNVLIRTQNVQLLLNTLQKPFFHLVSCWQRRMRRLLLHYPSTSAEFMSRDRFNFIRKLGQVQITITMYDRTSELLCRHLLLLQAQADFVATVHKQCKLASSVRNSGREIETSTAWQQKEGIIQGEIDNINQGNNKNKVQENTDEDESTRIVSINVVAY